MILKIDYNNNRLELDLVFDNKMYEKYEEYIATKDNRIIHTAGSLIHRLELNNYRDEDISEIEGIVENIVRECIKLKKFEGEE